MRGPSAKTSMARRCWARTGRDCGFVWTGSEWDGVRLCENEYIQRVTGGRDGRWGGSRRSRERWPQKASNPEDPQTLSRRVLMAVPSPNASSPEEFTPRPPIELIGCTLGRVLPPPVNSPLLLALNELMLSGAIVLLVNALLLATRWMMSSEAMTCPSLLHQATRPKIRVVGKYEPESQRG